MSEQKQGLPAGVEANSKEHVEWLVRERGEVVGLWPGSPYKIGDIIEKGEIKSIEVLRVNRKSEFGDTLSIFWPFEQLAAMTNLVKKVEWWQHREPGQMPGYVKKENGKVMRVDKYEFGTDTIWLNQCPMSLGMALSLFIPATLAEYEKGGG